MVFMNVQKDIFNSATRGFNYTNWLFPSMSAYFAVSKTGKYDTPEIIEVCTDYLREQCNTQVKGCALIIGVAGRDERRSSYRLKGFVKHNRLEVGKPLTSSPRSESFNNSQYDYFWFSINDTVVDRLAQFDYQISIGTDRGHNPDLFVALMDGRDPTDKDFDLSSSMMGADSIKISSTMNIWEDRGWNSSYGVLVTVAVKKPQASTPYRLVLTNMTKEPPKIQIIEVASPVQINHPADTYRPKQRVFQYYNWEHKDIMVTLSMRASNATLMYGKTGQTEFSNNIFTAIPISKVMAEKNVSVAQNTDG